MNKPNIVIYEYSGKKVSLNADIQHNTIWATQKDIEILFDIDQSVISRHINNIFKDKEVDIKSNMQKMHNAISDKPVNYYSLNGNTVFVVEHNLDVIRQSDYIVDLGPEGGKEGGKIIGKGTPLTISGINSYTSLYL